MTDSPFSPASIDAAIQQTEDDESLDIGVECLPNEKPSLTVDVQGSEGRLTWSAWAKTKFTKATTAVGAKVGFKW